MTYLNSDYDQSLAAIKDIKWLPWVGDHYGTVSPRVLLLGESHYNWGNSLEEKQRHAAELDSKDFTRRVIDGRLLPEPWQPNPFHAESERLLLRSTSPDRSDKNMLWRSIVFHNLVLRPMLEKKQRPNEKDCLSGWAVFLDLLDILKPTHVLCAGSDNRKLNTFMAVLLQTGGQLEPLTKVEWSPKISNAQGKYVRFSTCAGTDVSMVMFMHPSSRNFSWSKWAPFVHGCMPDLKRLFASSSGQQSSQLPIDPS